jgi:hypothetical protein
VCLTFLLIGLSPITSTVNPRPSQVINKPMCMNYIKIA